MNLRQALTFDDVLLVPAASATAPADADIRTRLTRHIPLELPLLSAAMDTVTEAPMAVAMAQAGGLGIIHRNLAPEAQAGEVARVKRFESAVVADPVCLSPDSTLGEARAAQTRHGVSGFPVIAPAGHLAGIVTARDMRLDTDPARPIGEIMTADNLLTMTAPADPAAARRLMKERRVEKIIVTDAAGRLEGLLTLKDSEAAILHPRASKDRLGRLRVGAATGGGADGIERARALVDAGADAIVLDTAHGHARYVAETVEVIRAFAGDAAIIAGNVATREGAGDLAAAGADAIKVGVGPGSICTTRIVAGVGVPQLSAIADCADAAGDVPVIADGGIRYSGDIAKAVAAGASAVMVGSLLAGTEEAPGESVLCHGRRYKLYRGMGSQGAMSQTTADRYLQSGVAPERRVPEGIEGQVPYKGVAEGVLHQLAGGLRAAMAYTGCATLTALQTRAEMVQITPTGLRESHPHSVDAVRDAPNYAT